MSCSSGCRSPSTWSAPTPRSGVSRRSTAGSAPTATPSWLAPCWWPPCCSSPTASAGWPSARALRRGGQRMMRPPAGEIDQDGGAEYDERPEDHLRQLRGDADEDRE